MAELSPLAQSIWRRYGDAPGLIRTAPFLRVFERAERMSRLPLLDVVKRWVPADAAPFQQVGRGFADFALPPRSAVPSARWPAPESSSVPIVSDARHDLAPHVAAVEGPFFQEPSSSRSDESRPLEDHAGPAIVPPLRSEPPAFPEAPDSRPDPQSNRVASREEISPTHQPGLSFVQPGFPIAESIPGAPSPPAPTVQAMSSDRSGQSAGPVVRAVASDTSRQDTPRPGVHSPALIGRPFQLQKGVSLEALSARGPSRAEPPAPLAVASVRPGDSEPPLPLVKLDAGLAPRSDASPVVPRVAPPLANLPLRGPAPGPAPEPSHTAPAESPSAAGAAPLVVRADANAPFDSVFPAVPQPMTLAPVVQRQADASSDAPSQSDAHSVVSVPIRPDVSASALSAPEVDVSRVADQVYSLLVDRLAAERDRRGY
jgi:hypothetical protein